MTTLQALVAFFAAAAVLTVTPGVDTAMVIRSAAAGGPRSAAWAAGGIELGCLIWGAAVSVGLGALLTASQLAFTAVKWIGAAYLVYLGARLIVRPRTKLEPEHRTESATAPRQLFRQGLLTNLLNPKVGVFYITFLPQFIPAGANVPLFSFALASIHVVLGVVWFMVLIMATVPLQRALRRPAVMRKLDRLTGCVFLAFGGKLALSR